MSTRRISSKIKPTSSDSIESESTKSPKLTKIGGKVRETKGKSSTKPTKSTKPVKSNTKAAKSTKSTANTPKADIYESPTHKVEVNSTDHDILEKIYSSHHNETYPISTLFNPYCTEENASKLLIYNGTLANNCDFMVFDNKVFTVKLWNPDDKTDTTSENRLIMVNLDEIDELYQTTSKNNNHQTNFRKLYSTSKSKNSKQDLEKENEEDSEKEKTVREQFNICPYPLTGSDNKWISVCYLIPYLFYSQPLFINYYSNWLFAHILDGIDTEKEKYDISNPLSQVRTSQKRIGTYKLIKPKIISKSKIQFNSDKTDKPKSKAEKKETKQFLLYSQMIPIIPRLLENEKGEVNKTHKANLDNYLKEYKINDKNISTQDISVVKEFYKQLNPKLYNPTDITVINQIMKFNKLPSTIKIVKIETSKFKETKEGIEFDDSVYNEFEGIKKVEKKERGKNSSKIYTSQKCFEIELSPINPKLDKLTLASIFTYAVQQKKIKVDDLKAIKNVYPIEKDKFDLLSEIVNTEGFEKFKFSNTTTSKKSSAKTPKRALIQLKSIVAKELESEESDSEENEENSTQHSNKDEDSENEVPVLDDELEDSLETSGNKNSEEETSQNTSKGKQEIKLDESSEEEVEEFDE